MKKDKGKPQKTKLNENRSRLADKKLDEDILENVSGGKGNGILGVAYTDTVDISESIQQKI